MRTAPYLLAALAIAFAIHARFTLNSERAERINERISLQAEVIKERAASFYEAKLGVRNPQVFENHSNGEYILTITIPEGHRQDFQEWMKGYGFSPFQIAGIPHEFEIRGGIETESTMRWEYIIRKY